MKAPSKREIRDYLNRVKNLTKPIPGIKGIRELDLKAPAPGPDPRIQIDPKGKVCTLYYAYPYSIDLVGIRSPKDLLWLIHHLTSKRWIDRDTVHELIMRIASTKGFKPYDESR